MPEKGPGSITELLEAAEAGNQKTLLQLWERVEGGLQDIADGKIRRERDPRAMEAIDLVNEAFVRLFGKRQVHFENRKHFYCYAAKVMVNLLIDDANRRESHLGMSKIAEYFKMPPREFSALKECVGHLEKINARAADVVRMRFFSDRTVEQTADYLEISTRTVESDFQFARAWLHRCLRLGEAN